LTLDYSTKLKKTNRRSNQSNRKQHALLAKPTQKPAPDETRYWNLLEIRRNRAAFPPNRVTGDADSKQRGLFSIHFLKLTKPTVAPHFLHAINGGRQES
jgi:hypothetical protein